MGALDAARILMEEIGEPGAHVFFDDWEVNFFDGEEPVRAGSIAWVEVARRAATALASLPQRFLVRLPLISLDELPQSPFQVESLDEFEDWHWDFPAIYLLDDESPWTERSAGWFSDDAPKRCRRA
jgi:hypothetical protein